MIQSMVTDILDQSERIIYQVGIPHTLTQTGKHFCKILIMILNYLFPLNERFFCYESRLVKSRLMIAVTI